MTAAHGVEVEAVSAPVAVDAGGVPLASIPVALIAGTTAGGALVLALAVTVLACCCCRRRGAAKPARLPKRSGDARNAPGSWHFMISYTQRSDKAGLLAAKLRSALGERGFSVWLDVHMKDKSEAAMQEAVENSSVILAIITGEGAADENAYFNRPFCVNEMRWAFAAGRHVQPVVDSDDKKRIGAFIAMAPDDLKRIGSIDFVDLNLTDMRFFNVGVEAIVEKAPHLLQGGAKSLRASSAEKVVQSV